jgi:hypothetical protein
MGGVGMLSIPGNSMEGWHVEYTRKFHAGRGGILRTNGKSRGELAYRVPGKSRGGVPLINRKIQGSVVLSNWKLENPWEGVNENQCPQ